MVDIHDLENLTFPAHVSFFDTRNTVGLNFVSHLFTITGFTLQCLALDVMHIFDLGISQRLIGTILRTLISKNFTRSNLRRAKPREIANLVALRRSFRNVTQALTRKLFSGLEQPIIINVSSRCKGAPSKKKSVPFSFTSTRCVGNSRRLRKRFGA